MAHRAQNSVGLLFFGEAFAAIRRASS